MKPTPGNKQPPPRIEDDPVLVEGRLVARFSSLLEAQRLPRRYWVGRDVFDDCGAARDPLLKLTFDVTEFVRSTKISTLILYGMPDSLRQFALGRLFMAASFDRHECLYLRASEILSMSVEGKLHYDDRPLDEVALGCALLALDDLGRENTESTHARVLLEDLLTQRFDNFRTTIVTTALNIDEIGHIYGASFARMLQRQAKTLDFTGTEAAFAAWAEGSPGWWEGNDDE